MEPLQINPNAIKEAVKSKAGAGAPKAAFNDVLAGISAMGPATGELMSQWTGGNDKAGAVLNAAFSGIDVAGGYSAGGAYGAYGPYSASPGVFGTPSYTTQAGFTSGKYASSGITGLGGTNIDDPAQYQQQIMQTMNENNLKLLELQALMQSNMQSWTTKSNILSADHRARTSIIEKFTARG